MAGENDVTLNINVFAHGQEAINQVNKGLDDLTKTTDKSTALTKVSTTELDKWTNSLVKEVPALKFVTPLMQQLGLGSIMTGGALAGIGIASLEAAQSLDAMAINVSQVGIHFGESGGTLQTWTQTLADATVSGQQWGVTTDSILDAEKALSPEIIRAGLAQTTMNDALKISQDTGLPLTDVVKNLSDAYSGQGKEIYDANGKRLLGLDAMNKEAEIMKAQQTPISELDASYSHLASRGLEDLKIGFGAIGKVLLDVIELPVVWLAQTEIAVGKIIGFLSGVDWGSVWSGIGSGLKGALNWAIGYVNSFTGSISGGIIPKIPTLDTGAIVTGPTLAMLSANGRPESVTPLGSGGGAQTINLYLSDGTQLATWVYDQLNTTAKLRGAY